MLLAGTLLMGFFLMLVGGLQGRLGHWGTVDGSSSPIWVITDHDSATKGIIVCSYLFVCSFAITMGPVSWTYPAEIFPMRVRAKAVSVSTAVRFCILCTSTSWVTNKSLRLTGPSTWPSPGPSLPCSTTLCVSIHSLSVTSASDVIL